MNIKQFFNAFKELEKASEHIKSLKKHIAKLEEQNKELRAECDKRNEQVDKLIDRIAELSQEAETIVKEVNAEEVQPEVVEVPAKVETVVEIAVEVEAEPDEYGNCTHCKKSIKKSNRISAADESGLRYVICSCGNCMRLSKDHKLSATGSDQSEIQKAYKLFKKAGINPGSYSYSENGYRHTL